MFASNYRANIFHQMYVLFLLSVKTPDLKSWPCFSNVPICTLYPDIPKGTGLDYTHWVSEPWSLNADLLKESYVGHLGELVWQGSEHRLFFRSRLSCRQVHWLCCEGPLISGGRGGTHPASDKAYPAYHNDFFFFLLSVNYSLIPLCTLYSFTKVMGLHSLTHIHQRCPHIVLFGNDSHVNLSL